MDFLYQTKSGMSLDAALSAEWLEVNGLGGYASATATGCNTRKYHGLLVSKLFGLPNKYNLLNTVDDVLQCDNKEHFLTAHNYPGCFQDGSFFNLQEFSVITHPLWKFQFGTTVLTKEILMLDNEDTVLLKYQIKRGNNKKCKITLRPLLAARDFHHLQSKNPYLKNELKNLPNGFSCMMYAGMPILFFQATGKCGFIPQPFWYYDFVYKIEMERGYNYQEDLFSPGLLVFSFDNPDDEVIFSCSLVEQTTDLKIKWQKEIKRRKTKNDNVDSQEVFQEQLSKISKTFIVRSTANSSCSVTAGYHWFLEWGRDAMISLPGLALVSNQDDLYLDVLKTFARQEYKGLIPNFLGNTAEENAYNSVDASLWFAWAVQQYYLKTKNIDLVVKSFWPTLENIYNYYKEGTLYEIKMQANGLLFAGSQTINLTWMDAVINGVSVTPRYGFAVEINALWFNFIKFIGEITLQLKLDPLAKDLKKLATTIKNSFREVFWCEEKKYLYDFVNSSEKNSSLRPNQIFAISLPFSPLTVKMAVDIMSAVTKHLLTPYGLRTLSPSDVAYIGSYEGDQISRDQAYHNGTVWPWLLGHFTEALLKTTANKQKVIEIIKPSFIALQNHLAEYGIGSIAEVFSGNAPHKPGGCISQAWSVAEVLRALYLLGFNNE